MKIQRIAFYDREVVIEYCPLRCYGSESDQKPEQIRVVYDNIKYLKPAPYVDSEAYTSVPVFLPTRNKGIILIFEKPNIKKGILEERLRGVFKEDVSRNLQGIKKQEKKRRRVARGFQ